MACPYNALLERRSLLLLAGGKHETGVHAKSFSKLIRPDGDDRR